MKQYPEGTYVLTGVNKAGKRFVINTITPQHYNIWKGSCWRIIGGKRTLVKRYVN